MSDIPWKGLAVALAEGATPPLMPPAHVGGETLFRNKQTGDNRCQGGKIQSCF